MCQSSGNLQVMINIVQMVVVSSLLPVPPGFWNPSVKGDSLGLPLQLFQCPLHHLVQLRLDLGLHEGELAHAAEKGLLVFKL